jgi:hypothetical protein
MILTLYIQQLGLYLGLELEKNLEIVISFWLIGFPYIIRNPII